MPEFLTEAISMESPVSPATVAIRLLLALVYGIFVAMVYRLSHGRGKSDGTTLVATLVLLSILIAMVSMVIGNSVARAFSLVGALSIVRFRTVVDDTRDTAFVIFAVIVGMAAGTGLWLVPCIGIPIVGLAAIVSNRAGAGGASAESTLKVRLGLGNVPGTQVTDVFTQHLLDFRLVAVETARQGSALDFSYATRLRPDASLTALVADLNRVEGVQSVEFRKSS